MSTVEHSMVGELSRVVELLQDMYRELRRGVEWGGTGDLEKKTWLAAGTDEFAYDGIFASIGVFNLSAGVIRVSLTPNGARVAGQELLTLSARGFIILPYRGTTVSVGGDAGGSALVVAFDQPQPANAGTF